MKRRRHTPEQVIRKLREADRLLGEGRTVPEVAEELEVSENTCHRWRIQFGGMKAEDVKRLKELEREDATLKRIVADRELENSQLHHQVDGTRGSRSTTVGVPRRGRPPGPPLSER